MATFSRLEMISEELSEKEVENVCDGVYELSLCDIQIATEGYSMGENQKTEGKDQPLSSVGNPNDAKQNLSNPQNEHHSSTDDSLIHSQDPSQCRRKISVDEASDAVFAERKNIRVFHKKFAESMLSENSRIFNKKL